MAISESREMYLETILVLSKEKKMVRAIDVASSLNVSKPAVSKALSILRENGFLLTDEEGALTLTEKGLSIAQRTYKRHMLLTDVLMKLGVSQETAESDACKIEHDISEDTILAIEKYAERMK